MKLKPFSISVAYFVAVIVIAHFFTPPGYRWTYHTISDLASQGHTYKWIMQAGLIGFGLLISLSVGMAFMRMRKVLFPLLLVAVYGISILLSGIFCAAPIDPSISYSVSDSNLHSMFATIAGVGLSLAILWQLFQSTDPKIKRNHFVFLLLVMGLSGAFGMAENGMVALDKGIVQRFLYLSGLAWLVYQEWLLEKEFLNERK